MTAIIYEIKHNSALRHVGQLSTSLNKSPLFTARDLIMQSRRLLQVSNSCYHQNSINQYTDLPPALKKTHILSMSHVPSLPPHPAQTKWNMCKPCNLQAIFPQAVFVDYNKAMAKLFNFWFLVIGWTVQWEKCQCQDSMQALGTLASSQQLLQMVCSLCRPLSQHCLWRAIN